MKDFINGNCMDHLPDYPDNYFDLAIVDPPYGIKQDGHRKNNRSKLAKSKAYHKALWNQEPPGPEYFKELLRVSKNQIIWGANNYPQYLKPSPCWVVWDKNNTGNFADCELAFASFATAVRMFKYTWNGMIQGDMKNKETRIHPTQKPVQLYKWLLRNYAKPEFKILDTHVGSASSLIAFEDFHCEYVGYEIDQEYYNAALQRLNNHKQQLQIF